MNDKIDGRALKAFEANPHLLKRGSNARSRTVTFDEYHRLLQVSPPHLRIAMILAFNTGMRKREILSLKWENLADAKRGVLLSAEETKEGRTKFVPFNHYVIDALNETGKNSGHVICYQGRPVTEKDALKKSLSTACRSAGIPYGRKKTHGLIFHDFRRTFKTNMASAGIDKAIRDSIVGHSLPGMDGHYIKPGPNALLEAIEAFACWLEAHFRQTSCERDTKQV